MSASATVSTTATTATSARTGATRTTAICSTTGIKSAIIACGVAATLNVAATTIRLTVSTLSHTCLSSRVGI